MAGLLALSVAPLAYPATALAGDNVPPAATTSAPSIDWIVGSWSGTGLFSGRASTVSLTVTPILQGTAYQFDYRFEVPAAAGKSAISFSGQALYRRGTGDRWDARWLDSIGNMHDISARITNASILAIWGSPKTEIGQTHYRLDNGKLKLIDSVLDRSGNMVMFNEAELTRQR